MRKDPTVYIIHILESIERIREYYSRLKDGSADQDMAYDAIIRNLETMAEAATDKLPDSIKAKYPAINWDAIRDLRIRLAHIYLDIDRRIIDQTIENDLSELYDSMRQEIPDWDALRAQRDRC